MSVVETHCLQRLRPVTPQALAERSRRLRLEIVDVISHAPMGHYSSSLSCAEILVTLYHHVLRLRRGEPDWPDRDRFLLGKGPRGCGALAAVCGAGLFPRCLAGNLGGLDSRLTDHPDMHRAPGIDFSSGSLGHNLSVGLGMAMAAAGGQKTTGFMCCSVTARFTKARFGKRQWLLPITVRAIWWRLLTPMGPVPMVPPSPL